jgi:hypothetical protein
MSLLPLVRIWLWLSTLATLAGWSLSALGALNRVGYLVFGGVASVALWCLRRASGPARERCPNVPKEGRAGRCAPSASEMSQDAGVPLVPTGAQRSARPTFKPSAGLGRKVRARFRRWLPAGFAVLAFLILLGGLLYAPTNHAALTYRTPRVLNWLTEGHWFWIHTPNYRMNDRACGIEWLSAPLLLFTKSDRSLFLINFLSYLLLPGLIFSVFTRLGVRPRVAWHWMWLLPTGYSFLLQAGSVANDTFPTVYALAALDFGLRAWTSRKASDLWLSFLAAALLTGAKASNLTLLLPWAIVVTPLLPILLRKPVATFALLLVAATVSFLPSAALNVRYCGDWSGLSLERAGMDMKSPLVGIWGNGFQFAKNLVPPFFPAAKWWNQSALTVLPPRVVKPLVENFEPGFHTLGEMPTEDAAGLGFGVSVLVLISVVAALARRGRASVPASPNTSGTSRNQGSRGRSPSQPPVLLRRLLLLAPWVSLLAYCVKSGMNDAQRLISPYYALLLPSLLAGARQSEIVRRRWWQFAAAGVLLLAFPVLIMLPSRPLWPARTILSKLNAAKPGQRLISRALEVYTVYGNRADSLAEVRGLLPGGLKVVGFLGNGDDIDMSLWRPLFTTRVQHILLEDTAEQIRQRHIQYAVVGGGHLASMNTSLAAWCERTKAEVVGTVTATQTVSLGPQPWHVVKLLPASAR